MNRLDQYAPTANIARTRRQRALWAVLATLLAPPLWAQLGPVQLPRIGALPALGNTVNGLVGGVENSAALSEVRNLRIQELLRTQSKQLERDPDGNPIVRAQIVAISPAPQLLEHALSLGFAVLSTQELESLALTEVVLRAPEHWSTHKALKALRELDPVGTYDYNHVYLESASEVVAAAPDFSAGDGALATIAPAAMGGTAVRVGLIDAGVDLGHPVFLEAQVHTHGCANQVIVSAHGTAVASLLAGHAAHFSGAAPLAELYAADVYCGQPSGGAVAAVLEALAWMADSRVAVINVSLVGPPNATLAAVVHSLVARGFLLVAAVGNDGPAAPPLYPAAYPGVVGVTAVDAKRKVLLEACRGPQVRYAAPGADMMAAAPGGTYARVRGTSFAAPLVAGLLARSLRVPDTAAAASALEQLNAQALNLGAAGRNPTYGYGLVGEALRTPPGAALPVAPAAH
jgi:subtilisin family serine protease